MRSGPVLLHPAPPQVPERSPLALWHLLSLDAPTVAAVWVWFIARCTVKLPWTSPLAMFLAVWMLYAADRMLDARSPYFRVNEMEERHHFHLRHRVGLLTGILAASIVLGVLLPQFSFAELRLYAALGSLLFGYFFLIHLWPRARPAGRGRAARLPKELAVGVFFPAAVFIPTVARAAALQVELLPAALLLAAVCTLNCLYVYHWEHSGASHRAHWTTRLATQHLSALCATTAAFGAASSVVWAHVSSPTHRLLILPLLACTASAALFVVLDASRRRLRPVVLRALADAALLTPLLCLPLLRVLA